MASRGIIWRLPSKNDYRMFKVVRMKNISLTKELFQSNDNIADLLSDFEKRRNQTNITVVLSYKKEIDTQYRPPVIER